jgi:hypothetical protein
VATAAAAALLWVWGFRHTSPAPRQDTHLKPSAIRMQVP